MSRRSTILPLYQYVKLRPKFQFNVNQSQIPQSITNHSFCGQSNANLIPILEQSVNLEKIVNPLAIHQGLANLGNNQPICEQSLTNLLTKFQFSSINVNPFLFRYTWRNCWDRLIIFTEASKIISHIPASTISVNPESIQCQFLANRRTFVQVTRELVYYRDRQLVSAVDDYTLCPFKAALTQCQGQTSNQRPFHRQSTNVILILDQSTNPSQFHRYFTLSN